MWHYKAAQFFDLAFLKDVGWGKTTGLLWSYYNGEKMRD